MNPNDYDEDGNNIIPYPIYLNNYCPSKGRYCHDCDKFIEPPVPDDERGNCRVGGIYYFDFKCPKEDEFINTQPN